MPASPAGQIACGAFIDLGVRRSQAARAVLAPRGGLDAAPGVVRIATRRAATGARTIANSGDARGDRPESEIHPHNGGLQRNR
jgi:hypothetical protein